MGRFVCRILLLSGLIALPACATVGYYKQMLDGHLQLMAKRELIDKLLADKTLPPGDRDKLVTVSEIRDFASSVLLLPDNDSYRSYADIKRPFVTWNVVATPPFSLQPKTWCFIIAGCVAYRGFYREEAAHVYADSLKKQGFDVAVSGALAYSTLGWFDDPVLSTMLAGADFSLASVIFHELAHQQLYVADSSEFNEAFATFVARVGALQWIEAGGRPADRIEFEQRRARREGFLSMLKQTREALSYNYRSGLGDPSMLREKRMIFKRLREKYAQLRGSWGGYRGYDAWVDQQLNNAHLATLATYYRWVPAFARLFQQAGNFGAFYAAAEALAQLPADQRARRLDSLAAQED